MTAPLEGSLVGTGVRVAIAVARFNAIFSKQLLEGCLDALRRHGVAEADVTVAWVPGSFELPLVARRLAETKRFDAVVCLGAVIRGATPHFDLVCAEAAKGVAAASLATGVPVAFGVVTCDTVEQAIDRCGAKAGNKGADAALAAIEMANLLKQLPK